VTIEGGSCKLARQAGQSFRSRPLAMEWFLAVSSGFGDQVCVVPAWRVDEGVRVSLAA
jgi:hypothetical protein